MEGRIFIRSRARDRAGIKKSILPAHASDYSSSGLEACAGDIARPGVKKLIVVAVVVVIEVAVALTLIPLTNLARVRSTDFVNFYAAASIVHDGNGARLYERQTQDRALESILGQPDVRYYLHPAFEAAAFAPMTRMGIARAFVLWTLINVALLGLLPLVLMPCVPLVNRRPFLGLLGFCFLPAITALTLGQDSILLLFAISLSYMLMYKGKDGSAGLALALAIIKFQYVLILVPLLLFSRKMRLTAGFGLGCAALAFASCLVTGWRGFLEYFRFLHAFTAHSGYGALNPSLMVSLRGFLAGMGWTAHWPVYVSLGGGILFCLGVACSRTSDFARSGGLIFGLYTAISLAAAPYAHFPDMTVLLLPVLLAMDWVAETGIATVVAKLISFCCVFLFVWPWLLLVLHGHYWWNSQIYLVFPLIIIFIAALAAAIIGRAREGQRLALNSLPLGESANLDSRPIPRQRSEATGLN